MAESHDPAVSRPSPPPGLPHHFLGVEVTGREPAWIAPTAGALADLLELPSNWNSYGAHPVDAALIQTAFGLLVNAGSEWEFPPPIVVPTSRGGVQLEWHTRGIDLELEVKPDGRHHLFFEDLLHQTEWEGDVDANTEPLATALAELARHP